MVLLAASATEGTLASSVYTEDFSIAPSSAMVFSAPELSRSPAVIAKLRQGLDYQYPTTLGPKLDIWLRQITPLKQCFYDEKIAPVEK